MPRRARLMLPDVPLHLIQRVAELRYEAQQNNGWLIS